MELDNEHSIILPNDLHYSLLLRYGVILQPAYLEMAMDIKLEYSKPQPITLTFQLRVREADRGAFRKQTGLAEPMLGTATITLQPGDLPNEYYALLSEGVRQQPELVVPFPCTEAEIKTSLKQALEADLTGKQLFTDLQTALENYRADFTQRHDAQISDIADAMQTACHHNEPQHSVATLEALGQRLQDLHNEFNGGQRIIVERFYAELERCPTIQLRTANETNELYDLIYRAKVSNDHQRLGLSEGTGSYGPIRLDHLLENHDSLLRSQREALDTWRNETRKKEYIQSIDVWIQQCGSERLRLAREQGYPIDRLYYQERAAQALSVIDNHYHVDFDQAWEASIKSAPSLAALRLEKRLRELVPEVASLVVLAAPVHALDNRVTQPAEMVCLSGLFDGCPEIYVEVEPA